MKKNLVYKLIIVILLITMACGFSIGNSTDETVEPEETEEPVETEEPTEIEVVEDTPDDGFQATADSIATQAAAIVATQLAQVGESTVQASGMMADIERLYQEKIINTTDGEYVAIPGFDETWAQLGWYQWYDTGYSPANFVLKTDMTYETASTISDWPKAGCGFVFRLEDNDNNYAIFYTLDGYVYMWSFESGKYVEKGRGYYGKPSTPDGNAQLMLVAEDDWVTFFVNGKQVFRKQDSKFSSGGLYYSLQSGTNKDYGQHCVFENSEMWVLP